MLRASGSGGAFASTDERYNRRQDPLIAIESRTKEPLGVLSLATLRKYYKHPKDEGNHFTMRSRLNGGSKNYYCRGCRVWHEKSLEKFNTLPILLGDSQTVLHGPKYGAYEGDEFHVEYVCNGGSSVMQCAAYLVFYYWHTKLPMVVVLLAGTNDFMQGRSIDDILSSYQAIKLILEELDEKNNLPKGSSRLVVATVPMAPKLYLQNGGKVDSTKPYFTENGKRLATLNKKIIELNKQTRAAPFLTWKVWDEGHQ